MDKKIAAFKRAVPDQGKSITFSRVLKTPCSGRLFKNAPMQGAQKLQEGGVYEKYVE